MSRPDGGFDRLLGEWRYEIKTLGPRAGKVAILSNLTDGYPLTPASDRMYVAERAEPMTAWDWWYPEPDDEHGYTASVQASIEEALQAMGVVLITDPASIDLLGITTSIFEREIECRWRS